MTLTRRERLTLLALGAAVALLLLDRYALTPYLAQRAKLALETKEVTKELTEAQRLFTNRRRVDQAWRDLLAHGLKTEPSEAESQTLHALRDWAQASHVEMQSLKPDRGLRSGDFQQIRFQASGTGTTAALAALLWRIETSELPLRVNNLRLTSRKEGSDDLAFQLSVSTLLFTPPPPKPDKKADGKPDGKAIAQVLAKEAA